MASRPIYLDAHATTPLDPDVLEAMLPWLRGSFGNPHSSEHWFGWNAHRAIEEARHSIARLIGAEPDEIVFTSGATEANNLALVGAAQARRASHARIAVSAIEHKCVLESARALRTQAWEIDTIPVDSHGLVDPDLLERRLTRDTALVSIMAVNNEIGTVQPITEIGALCAQRDVWFHCDAAQAPAALPLDVWKDHVDLLSLSSHKIYGPIGVGALFVRPDLLERLHPVNFGGGQESGVRSGTLSPALCIGFGKACDLMAARREMEGGRIGRLRERLWRGIQALTPQAKLNGTWTHRHPGNLNVCFRGFDADHLLGSLQPHLAASTGSACTTGVPEPSHVLQAIGLSLEEADSSLRFGIGRFTTEEEIDRAVALMAQSLEGMQSLTA